MCSVKMNLTTKNQNKTPDTDHIKIDLLYELQLAGLFQKKNMQLNQTCSREGERKIHVT